MQLLVCTMFRLNLDTQNGVAVLNLGTNYNSDTYKLNGDQVDASDGVVTTADVADANTAVLSIDGYRELGDADLTPTTPALTDPIVAATPDNTDTFYVGGNSISVTVNGQEHTLHTFTNGETFAQVIAGINANTATTGVYAQAGTDNLATGFHIRLYVSDPSGDAVASGINLQVGAGNAAEAAATAGTVIGSGASDATRTTAYGLSGGADNGLGLGSTSVSGSVGDNILTDLGTDRAQGSIVFTQNATANETLVVANTTFYFTANSTGASNEILIGSSLSDTLDNALDAVANYAQNSAIGTNAFEFNQLDISRDGNTLLFTSKKTENVVDLGGAASTIASTVTGATTTGGSLNNASSTYGVKVDGITNSAFNGSISGFTASYTGTTDQLTLSVQVGDFTYTASKVDITTITNTRIRFLSDEVDGANGGYFDVQLQAGQVTTVNSQSGADTVANRLNSAFSSLSFLQERQVTSYTGSQGISVNGAITGSLFDTSVTARVENFDSIQLTSVDVSTATGSSTDATIALNLGGVSFESAAGIGTTLGANQTYRLTSAEDANQYVDFTVGDTAIQLDNADKAAAFQTALEEAFGLNTASGSAGLNFPGWYRHHGYAEYQYR